MNRKEFDKTGRRAASEADLKDALRQVLVAEEPDRPRSENRQPSKAELSRRYRLDRRQVVHGG